MARTSFVLPLLSLVGCRGEPTKGEARDSAAPADGAADTGGASGSDDPVEADTGESATDSGESSDGGDSGVDTGASTDPDATDDDGDGFSEDDGDCDDTDATVHPDAVDACDGVDTDCDGLVDDDAEAGWILVTAQHNGVLRLDPESAAISELADFDDDIRPTSTDVQNDVSILYSQNDDTLRTFDACTGETEVIGHTGMDHSGGISFGPDGRLYGLDDGTDELVEIDLSTGEASAIGSLGLDIGRCGLAFDCSTGTMWGIDADSSELFEVDLETGAATNRMLTWVSFTYVGLEWWPSQQTLLASTGDDLYAIDQSTGLPTWIGGYEDYGNLNDLAFHPPCDE